jgi:nucleotide-binding universal stress UspA family protein
MTTVLVPLDGSELAQRAVPFAMNIAERDGRSLLLLRAVNTMIAVTPRDAQAMLNDATIELEAYAAALNAESVRIDTRIVDAPADVAILEAAEDEEIDLVVMSTHGRSGLGRWIYGSVADAVLRDAPVPVLIVPPHGLTGWSTDTPPKILVPLDGSTLAMAAIGPATQLADSLGATLVLGSVVTFPHYAAYAEGYTFVDPAPTENALAASRQYLQDIAAGLRTETRNVTVSAMFGSPFYGVATMAVDLNATLIVMATHGRGGIARAVLGSVATATLRQSSIPVLLVRPDELERLAASPVAGQMAEQPADQSATSPAAAPAQPAAPTITLTFSPEELEILTRAVGDRFFNAPVDAHQTDAIRVLLERLRTARPAHALTPTEASTLVGAR